MGRDELIEIVAAVEDIEARLPRPLNQEERARLELLAGDAFDEIAVAFHKARRNLVAELNEDLGREFQVLVPVVSRVIREMVSAAVMVGGNVGLRSASSSTGAESDSVTFADVSSVSWAGPVLTDELKKKLCLPVGVVPLGRFGKPWRWPERPL